MRKLVLLYCIFLFSNSIGATLIINENIQNWTARSTYGDYSQAIPAGTVNMTNCIVSPNGTANGTGTRGYVQINRSSGILELPEIPTAGIVEFRLRATNTNQTIRLQQFIGSEWSTIYIISNVGTSGQSYAYAVNSDSPIRLRLAFAIAVTYVHDILISNNPLQTPLLLSPADITSSGFTANWNAVDGATGYELDVYTGTKINELINTGFEGFSTLSPPTGWTLSASNSYITNGIYAHNGTYYAGLSDDAGWIQTPLISNPQNCSFWVRTSGINTNHVMKVQSSPDGASWTDRAVYSANNYDTGSLNPIYAPKSIELNLSGNFYLRWIMTYQNTGRDYIDDIVIEGPHPVVYYVSGYEGVSVGNVVSHSVTGLTPNSTFHYVVRAVSAYSTSDNSNEMEVTTNDYTLPVELSSFTASVIAQDHVQLNWTTQTETNLLGYYLYRGLGGELANAEQIPSLINATNTSQTTEYSFADREVSAGNTYHYWLQNLDLNGESDFHGPISVIIPESGDFTPEYILNTQLLPAYPNPFGRSTGTRFHYTLKAGGTVRIEVFNLKGQKVWSAVRQHAKAGDFHLYWSGTDITGNPLGSGIYHYRLTCGNWRADRKVVLK